MPSVSYQHWRTTRAAALDRLEAAHAAVGGSGPGRRYATEQINQAYLVLLAAEFQGFCRALHSECVKAIVTAVPTGLQTVFQESLILSRQINRGNATPSALGSDFGRLGIEFWPDLIERDPRVEDWQRSLGKLHDWRNAIVHSDFAPITSSGTMTLQLKDVRNYRSVCLRLARAFDELLRDELERIIGRAPW
jgi:hypothetical protein